MAATKGESDAGLALMANRTGVPNRVGCAEDAPELADRW